MIMSAQESNALMREGMLRATATHAYKECARVASSEVLSLKARNA